MTSEQVITILGSLATLVVCLTKLIRELRDAREERDALADGVFEAGDLETVRKVKEAAERRGGTNTRERVTRRLEGREK